MGHLWDMLTGAGVPSPSGRGRRAEQELQLAAAALLVEVAMVDRNFDQVERERGREQVDLGLEALSPQPRGADLEPREGALEPCEHVVERGGEDADLPPPVRLPARPGAPGGRHPRSGAPPPARGAPPPPTPACPIDCLQTIVGKTAFSPLARAYGAPFDPPATVGQVIELVRQGRLRQAAGLGPRRPGEIEAGLVLAGFVIGDGAPR